MSIEALEPYIQILLSVGVVIAGFVWGLMNRKTPKDRFEAGLNTGVSETLTIVGSSIRTQDFLLNQINEMQSDIAALKKRENVNSETLTDMKKKISKLTQEKEELSQQLAKSNLKIEVLRQKLRELGVYITDDEIENMITKSGGQDEKTHPNAN